MFVKLRARQLYPHGKNWCTDETRDWVSILLIPVDHIDYFYEDDEEEYEEMEKDYAYTFPYMVLKTGERFQLQMDWQQLEEVLKPVYWANTKRAFIGQ